MPDSGFWNLAWTAGAAFCGLAFVVGTQFNRVNRLEKDLEAVIHESRSSKDKLIVVDSKLTSFGDKIDDLSTAFTKFTEEWRQVHRH